MLTIGLPTVVSSPAGAAPAEVRRFGVGKAIGPTHLSSPTIADVNGDGHPDVVTADLVRHVARHRRPQRSRPSRLAAARAGRSRPDRRGRVEPDGRRPRSQRPQARSSSARDRSTFRGQQGGVVAFNANGSVRWRIRTLTVAGENGVRRYARRRRRERRRFPRRRVRQLRPPHLRAWTGTATRCPDSRWTRSTRSGIHPRSTTRVESAAWTSSSVATRARAVRAAAGVGRGSCARFA